MTTLILPHTNSPFAESRVFHNEYHGVYLHAILVRMLALASNITSLTVTLSRLTTAIVPGITLASMDASSGMKAAGTTGLAATATAAVLGAFVASTHDQRKTTKT